MRLPISHCGRTTYPTGRRTLGPLLRRHYQLRTIGKCGSTGSRAASARQFAQGKNDELLFASVPLEVWEQGAAAANTWIREHLPAFVGRGAAVNLLSTTGVARGLAEGRKIVKWLSQLRSVRRCVSRP